MSQRKKILKSFDGDELATDVFMNKYAMKNEIDELLEFSLDDMRQRLSVEIVSVEEKDKLEKQSSFYDTLKYFSPAGRILTSLGNPYIVKSSLSNCYYIPIMDDSIEAIYQSAMWQARIFSYGGGVGLDISQLRPKGSKVNNSAKVTSGAVSFMELYSSNTGLIGQNNRRGATILTIHCKHPDLIDFIQIKGGSDKSKVQFANVSVKITNEFMEQLINEPESDWIMEYVLESGEVITKKERIQTIWDILVESNWNGAEPGIIFWDKVLTNFASVFDESRPEGLNPCAEQTLEPFGSCNLGSINLSKLIENPFENPTMNYDNFKNVIHNSVRFLSNVNILNIDRQPLEQLKDSIRNNNKIGLGITGFADALIKMNLRYDSDDAIQFIDDIMLFFSRECILASINLAKERGMCKTLLKYKNTNKWNEFVNHPYFTNVLNAKELKELNEYGLANNGLTTIAPSGSISIIEQCSSGIEPIFALCYDRTVKQSGKHGKEEKYKVYHPLVKEYNDIYGENAHEKNPNFITAEDIDWNKRIQIQSTIQKYITDSISSTINLPNNIDKKTISDIYVEAYKQGLKGITIYRDGCRDNILKKIENKEFKILDEYKFPDSGNGVYKVIRSEGRKWYCWVTIDEETKLPNALFVNANKRAIEPTILTDDVVEHLIKLAKKHIKNGHLEKLLQETENSAQSNTVRMARLIGMLLRHRVPIINIIKTIENINPPIYSFIFQIKKLLGEYLPENTLTGEKCPECESMLIFESGCSICRNCGFSRCG